MKKLLSLVLAGLLFTTAVNAQTERVLEEKAKSEHQKDKHQKLKIAKELNLTKEQIAQLKESQKALKEKMKALKANDQITVKEFKEKRAAIKKEQQENLEKVLTPEQRAKLEELKKNRKEGHKKHWKNKGPTDSASV